MGTTFGRLKKTPTTIDCTLCAPINNSFLIWPRQELRVHELPRRASSLRLCILHLRFVKWRLHLTTVNGFLLELLRLRKSLFSLYFLFSLLLFWSDNLEVLLQLINWLGTNLQIIFEAIFIHCKCFLPTYSWDYQQLVHQLL